MAKRFKTYIPALLIVVVLVWIVTYFSFYPTRVMPKEINPVTISVQANTNEPELIDSKSYNLTPEQGQIYADLITSSVLISDPFLGSRHMVVEEIVQGDETVLSSQ